MAENILKWENCCVMAGIEGTLTIKMSPEPENILSNA